jgi:protein gp37
MAIKTKIEWCDSTLNLQMGCTGCELWNEEAGVKTCYAGLMTERYGGRKGWPASFTQPQIFPERIKLLDKWPDLTGAERPDKPWLNGLPRIVFLNDLGDTFTYGLPLNWLDQFVDELSKSPHIYIILTKRVRRMRQYFDRLHYVPRNFWLMTTVTSRASLPRLGILQSIKDDYGAFVGVSIEPMLSAIELPSLGARVDPMPGR